MNRLFKSKYYPIIPQFFTLIAFIFLIFGSIGITHENSELIMQLRNTNLANLIVWSYWWPIIIIVAVLFGRHWCSICPVELITSLFSMLGIKKKPSNFLKSKWLITLFYLLIIILAIHTFSIHRIPQRMSFYLIGLFILSILIGFIYEKRTFCTYICPVGNLLGLYALLSRYGLRIRNQETCDSCKTKDCIAKQNHYKLIGRSCTSELYPKSIQDNRQCILCTQCVKACPNNNIEYRKLGPIRKQLANLNLLNAELALLIILTGFIVYEVYAVWGPIKKQLLYIPDYVNNYLSVSKPITGIVKALLLFVIYPSIIFVLFGFISKTQQHKNRTNRLKILAIAFLPIIAWMHFAKALFKTSSRIPYLEWVNTDYLGLANAQNIIDRTLILSQHPHLKLGITLLCSILLGYALIISFKTTRLIISDKKINVVIGVLCIAYACVYFYPFIMHFI